VYKLQTLAHYYSRVWGPLILQAYYRSVGGTSLAETEINIRHLVWGLAAKECDSLVPADTSCSIFSEKHRSGDAGERDNMSGERGCCSSVSNCCSSVCGTPCP